MPRDTGLPSTDAQSDFSRARRRRALARLSMRLRREPDDVNHILPFEEVARALGRVGERRLGQELIPLDSIVGTVDRSREFDRAIRLKDLPLKGHQRLFFERVPLGPEQRKRIHLSDEWRYAALAEAVEAWGFRASQAHGEELSRQQVAEQWFRHEYEPVVEMLREVHLVPKGVSDTEAYMKVAHLRYLLLRTHDWDDAVIDAVRRDLEHPGLEDDTMVRKLRRELK